MRTPYSCYRRRTTVSVRQFRRPAALVCALLLGGAGNGTLTAQPFTVLTSNDLLSMQPGRFVELLARARPLTVSTADKARILSTLPEKGEIVTLDELARQKLAQLRAVLRVVERESRCELNLLDAPLARMALYDRAVVLMAPMLHLLTTDELQALAGHEIGHQYTESFAVAQTAAPEQEVVAANGGARVLEFTSPRVRFGLAQAIEGAARRLRSPECRRVFSDFKDASGNLLETNLIRFAADPADYLLKFVWFADGSDESQCHGRIAAFTEPGSHVVFVCGRHFEKKSREAELQIIHEILHSLGLGENPPSSDEINQQVARRCGAANAHR